MTLALTLESINYQGRSTEFLKALDNQYVAIIAARQDNDWIKVKKHLDVISDIVFRATGIQLHCFIKDPDIVSKLLLNPYTVTIELPGDAQLNPLQPKAMRRYVEATDQFAFEPRELIHGELDFKRCIASGYYSTIVFNLEYSTSLLDGRLLPEDLSNLLIHELSHAWDYLVMMGQAVITSALCAGIVDHFKRYNDPNKHLEFAKRVANASGEAEIGTTPDGLIEQVLRGTQHRVNQTTGQTLSPVKVSELMADRFTVQWGRGASMVRTLAKVEHAGSLPGKVGLGPRWIGVLGSASTLAGFPFRSFTTAATGAIPLGLRLTLAGVAVSTYVISVVLAGLIASWIVDRLNPHGRHPTLTQRIASIRRQHIQLLQERNLPAVERQAILSDLDAIDTTYKEVKSWESIVTQGFKRMTRLISGAAQKQTAQDSIADRTHNRLHELAARLETLR